MNEPLDTSTFTGEETQDIALTPEEADVRSVFQRWCNSQKDLLLQLLVCPTKDGQRLSLTAVGKDAKFNEDLAKAVFAFRTEAAKVLPSGSPHDVIAMHVGRGFHETMLETARGRGVWETLEPQEVPLDPTMAKLLAMFQAWCDKNRGRVHELFVTESVDGGVLLVAQQEIEGPCFDGILYEELKQLAADARSLLGEDSPTITMCCAARECESHIAMIKQREWNSLTPTPVEEVTSPDSVPIEPLPADSISVANPSPLPAHRPQHRVRDTQGRDHSHRAPWSQNLGMNRLLRKI